MSPAPRPPSQSFVVVRPRQNNIWLVLLTISQVITLGLVALGLVALVFFKSPSPSPTPVPITSTPMNTITPTLTLMPQDVTGTPTPTNSPEATSISAPGMTGTLTATITFTTECNADDYPAKLEFVGISSGPMGKDGNSSLTGDVTWVYKNDGGCNLESFSAEGNNSFYGSEKLNNDRLSEVIKLKPGESLQIVKHFNGAFVNKSYATLSIRFHVGEREVQLNLAAFNMPSKDGKPITVPTTHVTPTPTVLVTPTVSKPVCDLQSYPGAVQAIESPKFDQNQTSDNPENGGLMLDVTYRLKNTGNCELKIIDIERESQVSRLYPIDQITTADGSKHPVMGFVWAPGVEITLINRVYYDAGFQLTRFIKLILTQDAKISWDINIAQDLPLP